jgi:hypothetical protein
VSELQEIDKDATEESETGRRKCERAAVQTRRMLQASGQQEKESEGRKERVRERRYRVEKRLSLCGKTTHMPAASDASMIASTLACAALTVLASPSTSIRTIDRPNVGEARLLSTNDSARYP